MIKINKRGEIDERSYSNRSLPLAEFDRKFVRQKETSKPDDDDVWAPAIFFFFFLYLHCDAGRALA